MRRSVLILLGALLVVALGGLGIWQTTYAAKPEEDKAVERTRKQVKMLDDVYKSAVVLITTHYVNKETDLPAGSAAIALFDAVKQKGWHEVRLVDVSGEPLKAKNKPADEFEKRAAKELKAGQNWVEEVVEADGKKFLRAATPIPVVMKKCTLCHPNYETVKAGDPIGLLSYKVPLVD